MDSVSPSPEPFEATGNTDTNTNTQYAWSGTSLSANEAITPRTLHFPDRDRQKITPSPASPDTTFDSHSKPNHSGTSTPSIGNPRPQYDFSLPVIPEHNLEPDATFLAIKEELEAGPSTKDLRDEFDRHMQVGKMILLLADAENLLREGNADKGEEKAQAGLEIALAMSDEAFIERCQVLMEWVKNIRDKDWEDVHDENVSRDGEAKMLLLENRSEGGDEGNHSPQTVDDAENRQRESPTEEAPSREPSPSPRGTSTSPGARGGELLGEFLEDDLQEGQWQFAENEQSDTDTEGTVSEVQDDESYEDDRAILRDFDLRHRPQTPIPPRSPTPSDDEDGESIPTQSRSMVSSQQSRRQSTQQYNSWQPYNDPGDDQIPTLPRRSHTHSPSVSQPIYQYISESDSDSGNEEEDHMDADQALTSDPWTDSSSDEEEPLERKIVRKRKMPSIADTTLSYTYLHKHKRSTDSNRRGRAKPQQPIYPRCTNTNPNASRRTTSTSNPSTSLTTHPPKPWLTPSHALDTHHSTSQTPSPTLFYNPHNPTLLLRSSPSASASDNTADSLSWLENYNASPIRPSTSKFTFRKRLPVTQMAPRVRSTRLFPEQDWEFIPLRADWEEFVREGREKVSMAFLAWERERLIDLVMEKRRRWRSSWVGVGMGVGSEWSLGIGFARSEGGYGNRGGNEMLIWGVGVAVLFILVFLFLVFRLRS
ncbi:hypothetical protein BDV19DRAFT_353830 [Aspergillus venezuelensis]